MPRVNPVKVSIGSIGFVDNRQYGAEPTMIGNFQIPARFFTPGDEEQLTRGEFSEYLMQALEKELKNFRSMINVMRDDVGLPAADLPYGYKDHGINT